MLAAALFATLALVDTAPAAAQAVGFSLVPTAERIRWGDELAFDDDWLYGGRASFRFGDAVELQPFYFKGRRYGIDSSRAPALFGPASAGRTIDLEHYGITAQLNLARGSVVPFIRGGGGILRFRPDSGSRNDRLAVTAGGGLRFGFGQLQGELFAEHLGFRLDPLRLFSSDSITGGTRASQRGLVYGGAISIPLTDAPDEEDETGLRGSTAPIEPFVGRMRFDGGAGLGDLNLAGVRAGLDFSPLFGVRGFYWRGVNEDFDGFVSVEGFGAEGQFNLNTGPGISPYVVAGGGRINFTGGYRDSLTNGDNERNALILGAGASLQLSDRVRFNAALRDYITARGDSLEAASTTGDLTHNRMLTAGFTIAIGGTTGPSDRQRALEAERRERERRLSARDAEIRAVRDSVRDARDRRGLGGDRDDDRRDARDRRDAQGRPIRSGEDGMQGAVSDRWITVPVPAIGEVILRYGIPGSTSEPQRIYLRDSAGMRRDSTVMMPGTRTDSLQQQLAALEGRLMARIESMRQPGGITTPADPRVTIIDTVSGERYRGMPIGRRFSQVSSSDLRPFVGISGGDAGTQAVLSLRMDLGPVTTGLRFVPEFAIGLGGDGTSVLALANLQYQFGSIGGSSAVRPYVTGGAGIFSPSVLGVNTAVGASMDLRQGRGTPWLGYLELQGLNLFDDTRLLFGFSIR